MIKIKILALTAFLIVTFVLFPREFPSQLEELISSSHGNFQAIFIRDSFCITCPDGELVLEVVGNEKNAVFVGEDWSNQDIDNFTRSLQPECPIVISTEEVRDFFLNKGTRFGHIYSISISK